MRIIKHGDPDKTDRLRKFRCSECGCEWIAGPHEVYRGINGHAIACQCPECFEMSAPWDENAPEAGKA